MEAAADGGGGGGGGFGEAMNIFGALTGNPLALVASGVNSLMHNLADMKQFKKDVDNLLAQLHDSQAAPSRVGQDRVQRAHLGGDGFHEAQFLFASYDNVHTELENLSTVLGLQIESLGIAIETSGKSMDDLDEDIKARMHTLNAQIEAQYHPERDPYHDPGKGDAKSSGGGSAHHTSQGYGEHGGAK